MSDYNDLIRFTKTKLPTAIQQYPSGKFGIVGSIPYNLTREKQSGFSTIRVSMIWDTEQEVIDAILGEGIIKFQLSDCTWYNYKPGWENVYATMDTITNDEKLIDAYLMVEDTQNRCILCIQLSPERLDYEEVPVQL